MMHSRAAHPRALAALLVLAGSPLLAQLSVVQLPPLDANSVTRISGAVPSDCFTGKLDVELAGGEIRLIAELGCNACQENGSQPTPFKRYVPHLPAGAHTIILSTRPAAGCEGTAAEIDRKVITIEPGRVDAWVVPDNPMVGENVVLHLATACPSVDFELLPEPGRVRRVEVIQGPIGVPLPCDDEPQISESIGLGPLEPGEYTILLQEGAPREPALLKTLSFVVRPPDTPTLDLQGDRFRVTASWTTVAGASGEALAAPLTTDSGAFWFFRPDNLELLFKVLNGCAVNGHFWVLGAGLTDVGVEIEIEDTQTGATWTYENPLGQAFEPVQDTGAFDCP